MVNGLRIKYVISVNATEGSAPLALPLVAHGAAICCVQGRFLNYASLRQEKQPIFNITY